MEQGELVRTDIIPDGGAWHVLCPRQVQLILGHPLLPQLPMLLLVGGINIPAGNGLQGHKVQALEFAEG